MKLFASAGDGNIATLLKLLFLLLSLLRDNSLTVSATGNASECIVQTMFYFRRTPIFNFQRELPSTTQCYTFAMAQNNLEHNALIAATLIYPAKHDSGVQQPSDGPCELYQLQESDDKLPDSGLGFPMRSAEQISLAVRRHVDHRSAATRVGSSTSLQQILPTLIPQSGETWSTVMAWTTGTVSLLLDESCANRGMRLAAEKILAWSVCQPMTNGSSTNISFYQGSYIIFAQDDRLSSWLILPGTLACRHDTDYELIVSAAVASRTELYLRTAPQNDSCRMLCIEERCEFSAYADYYQTNLWSILNVTGSGSLRVQYKLRPPSAVCNQSAYSGFALYSYGRSPDLSITLTTYKTNPHISSRKLLEVPRSVGLDDSIALTSNEKNTHLISRELVEAPWSAVHVAALIVGCPALLSAVLLVLIFVARRKKRSPPKRSTMHFDAAQIEVAETTKPSTEYCSLDRRSDAHIYTVFSEEEQQYTSLKPNTETAIYSELLPT